MAQAIQQRSEKLRACSAISSKKRLQACRFDVVTHHKDRILTEENT
jgi:hypothetical protein